MPPNNIEVAYRILCWNCGQINHATVPIVAKNDQMAYHCENCTKIIIEFHTHELDEQKHEH